MTSNPIGAENAQVQDASMKAREVLESVYSTTYGSGSNLNHAIATALREAEQRGMRRAAKIVQQHVPDSADSMDRIVIFVLAAVVEAIERAASPEAED